MEIKTISYLNSKVWYRLVKVIYVFVFAIIAITGTVVILSMHNSKEVNYQKSEITCTNGNGISIPLGQVNSTADYNSLMPLSLGAHPDGWVDSLDTSFQNECEVAIVQMKDGSMKLANQNNLQQLVYSDGSNISKINGTNYTTDEANLDFVPDVPQGSYNLSLVTENNLVLTLTYLLIWLLANIVAFEVIRRVFYYIVLGTLMPKNHA